jgi:hypothetical protein
MIKIMFGRLGMSARAFDEARKAAPAAAAFKKPLRVVVLLPFHFMLVNLCAAAPENKGSTAHAHP